MQNVIPWGSAGFAFVAAALWLWSARVRLPATIKQIDFGSIDPAEPEPIDDLRRLTNGLKRQSRLSAWAAGAAAISASLQGVALIATP
jgi:hypothetical protein